jgi:hypothetical protein
MVCRLEMTRRPVCTIGVAMTHAPWGAQRCYLSADGVLLGPPYRRHDHARAMSHGRPEPALVRVLPNPAPPFINFRFVHGMERHADLRWFPRLDGQIVEVVNRRRCV